jgi:hypothetical protein
MLLIIIRFLTDSLFLKGIESLSKKESQRYSEETLKMLNSWLQPSSKRMDPSLKIINFRPSRLIYNQMAEETGLTVNKIRKWIRRQKLCNDSKNINNILLMKNHFSVDKFPKRKQIQELAKLTGRTEKYIKKWFTYERIKLRKRIEKNFEIEKEKSIANNNNVNFV